MLAAWPVFHPVMGPLPLPNHARPLYDTVPTGAVTPAILRTTYNLPDSCDGAGQTIAVIDEGDNPTALADLNYYSSYFGLPEFNVAGGPTFTKLDEYGGTNLPAQDVNGWSLEIALDLDAVHSIAPKANIILYEAGFGIGSSDGTQMLGTPLGNACITAKNNPAVSVVSCSWTATHEAGDAAIFNTPASHIGVTFVGASGDNGGSPDYPAQSYNVIGVGGTKITATGETFWGSAGHGINLNAPPIPLWQEGFTDQPGMYASYRTVPDVSADADPVTGLAVRDTSDDFNSITHGYEYKPWLWIGGTSLSAPVVAGLIAIVNQQRGTALDGPSQTLPGLYTLSSSAYNPIDGSHAYVSYGHGTGLGSPNAAQFVPELASMIFVNGVTTTISDPASVPNGVDVLIGAWG
jgi:subtilase family serine protease